MKRVLASDPDFERRARLSVVWQDLVTPVRAIAEYQEIIIEEGRRLGLTELMPYLDKVLAAARSLGDIVDRVRDARDDVENGRPDEVAGLEARLRHDLRTPLNAIIGYSEMVAEDLDGLAEARSLRSDVEKLLDESRRLLGQIDAIVDLSRRRELRSAVGASDAHPDVGEAAWSALFHTLRPAPRPERGEVARILIVDDNEFQPRPPEPASPPRRPSRRGCGIGARGPRPSRRRGVRPSPARPPDARHERHRGA